MLLPGLRNIRTVPGGFPHRQQKCPDTQNPPRCHSNVVSELSVFESRIHCSRIHCSGPRADRSGGGNRLRRESLAECHGFTAVFAAAERFLAVPLGRAEGPNNINLGGASKPRPGPSTFAPSVAAPQAQKCSFVDRCPRASGRCLSARLQAHIKPVAAVCRFRRQLFTRGSLFRWCLFW